MRARGRDVRLLGALIAAAVIAAIGGGIALAPAPARERPAAHHGAEVDLAFRQGVAMLHARRYDHAATAFHRVLEFAPRMPEAHANMGFAFIGLGRYGEAKAFFESALALRPRQDNAYYGLALAAEGMGDLEAARGAMRTYVHLSPAGDPYRRRAESALWEWADPAAGAKAGRAAGERP